MAKGAKSATAWRCALRIAARSCGVFAKAKATLTERSILDDPALEARWHDDIPVVLIDGRQHSAWRVDAAKLTERIRARIDAPAG